MFISAILEYDGSCFSGSQFQINARTVQGELELALKSTFNISDRVKFASRTDSGVHSLGQVVFININIEISLKKFLKILNDNLPSDILVRKCQEVDGSFDPRRDALAREYLYKISLKESISPFESRFISDLGLNIDYELLKESAMLFEGIHDFKSFTGHSFPSATKSSVRRIFNISCVKKESLIEIRVLGNSFIHQQVRRMIGLMVNISQGKNIPSKIEDVLASEERKALSLVAPTNGLYLSKILYPDGLFDLEQKNQKIEAKYVNSLK